MKGTKAARPGSKKKATAVAGAGAASATAGHSDAVMGLAWNKTARQLLASSSADTTCKLWDINTASVLHTFSHHRGKVSSVAWHPVEASILATASYDRTLSTLDAREGSASRVGRYALPADPECMLWNMHSPAQLIASTEDGSVTAYDVRSPDRPLWTVKAHTGAASGVSLSSLAPGMMATCGIDKCVKVWDIASPSGTAPVCIASKGMSIGQIFTVSFFAQSPFLLAAGGSKGMVAVWDVASDAGEVTPAAAAAAAREGVAATSEHSLTAQRFVSRIPADPSTIPGFGLRPRADGQPLA
ncbi:WD40 repeat domain-containing protein [archaeon]|nr:MAG: WD40 repeat domain-containing protein [archaeon]